MIAMVPMTLRGAEKGGDRGNQVGGTLMPVYSEIADPLERLRAISESALTSKRVTDAMGKELLRDLLEYTPAVVSGPMLRNLSSPARASSSRTCAARTYRSTWRARGW